MTVADGSQVRLAYIPEVTIGTTPSTPALQVLRYLTSDVRINKTTDIPNEVRSDRNVASIVDVGRNVSGSINGLLSYGTYDDLLSMLFCADWATDVLKNGTTAKTMTVEQTFVTGGTSNYVRFTGTRVNTLDLSLNARQSVQANFGLMGIAGTTATTAITGSSYTAATTTTVFNAGLNVGSLAVTGISNSPKMRSLTLRINNNIYQNDIVGQYAPYSHGLGRFEVTGTISAYFENTDAYLAILNHTDVALGFVLSDAAGNSYTISLPNINLLDGGPRAPGNGQAVLIDIPFQAKYDSVSSASMTITRAHA